MIGTMPPMAKRRNKISQLPPPPPDAENPGRGGSGPVPPDPPGTTTIRIQADLADMLTVISTIYKRSISDIVSPAIRDIVSRMHREALDFEGDKYPRPEQSPPD